MFSSIPSTLPIHTFPATNIFLLFIFIAATNGVNYEIWENIDGFFVENLKSDPRFPDEPDRKEVLDIFASPERVGDRYGARLTAYYRVRLE